MERGRTWPWTLGVMLVTAVAWWPVREVGWFWDDRGTFLDNPWLLRPDFWAQSLRPHLGHWQPLTWWSLRLDQVTWTAGFGVAAPRAYLLSNIFLHTLSAGALTQLLFAALRGRAADTSIFARGVAASAAALAWALHPCRVESVAWATERRDVLATLFALLGLTAWLSWRQALTTGATPAESAVRRGPRPATLLGLACVCFAASALAKAWVVALPGALLGLEIGILGARSARGALRRSAAWLWLAAPVAAMAAWAQHSAGATSGAGLNVLERVVGAGHHLLTYLGLTALPLALAPLHPIVAGTTLNAVHLTGFAGAAVLTGLVAWRGLRRDHSDAAAQLLGAWVGFVAWLAPVLGLLQSGVQAVAERYLILAHVPLVILAAPWLARAVGRRHVVAVALAGVLILAWSARMLAWQQVWIAGPEALWTTAIEVEPRSMHARVNRAALRVQRGAPVGDDLHIALALAPHDPTAWKVQAEVLRRAGRPADALDALQRARRAAPADTEIQCNLGAMLAASGDRDAAARTLDAAIRAGGGPDCRLNRAVLRVQTGRSDGAAADVQAALLALPAGHPTRQRAIGMARALRRAARQQR